MNDGSRSMEKKLWKLLIIVVGNNEKWMLEDCYNEGLEKIGKWQLCDEAHMSKLPNFTKMIPKNNERWSNSYDLGMSFRKANLKSEST